MLFKKLTDCDEENNFLGISIRYVCNAGLFLALVVVVDRVMVKFGMQDFNLGKTPMEKGCSFPGQGTNSVTHAYRELMGSIDAVHDICYGYLERFQNQPSESHWQELKRVARYVQGRENAEVLVGYADWASDTEDRKSVNK